MKPSRSAALLCLFAATKSLAQSGAVSRAAATITEADVRQRIELIAHDSMGGRDTPSPGLDKTAAWIAGEFKRMGLTPAGDGGGFIQRYPVTIAPPDPDSTFMEFKSSNGPSFKVKAGEGLAFIPSFGSPPKSLVTLPMMLLGGTVDSAQLASAEVQDQLVVWVADWSKGQPEGGQDVVRSLFTRGARGIVVLVNNDTVMESAGAGGTEPIVTRGAPRATTAVASRGRVLALVSERVVVQAVPEAAEQFAALRAAPSLVTQPLAEWRATAIAKIGEPKAAPAPNVVGILEGSDPVLKREHVVISAHMDHVGSRCRGLSAADRICNGADDDGSGTAGVVELAEAFAHKGAQPKRSIVFLAVSGEERGLWGSDHFTARPPVELKSIVANLNIDMIGRNWNDTIAAIGKQHSDLGGLADQVAARNKELGLTVVDDPWPEENLYGRSDHYNFARRGIPVLFFTSGLHEDYHAVTDTPDKIDAEKEARVLRLIFYLGQEIANRVERPKWTPDSYKKIVGAR